MASGCPARTPRGRRPRRPAAGHFAQATASLYRLRGLLAAQRAGGEAPPEWAAAMLGPEAPWKAEEGKLLWAQVRGMCFWGLVPVRACGWAGAGSRWIGGRKRSPKVTI